MLRFILDFYIIYLFFTTYIFLVRLKIKVQRTLTPYNKRVITATFAIVVLYIVGSYLANISSMFLEISYLPLSEKGKVVLKVFTQPVTWTI